ncbi:unnamed protein product [Schistosoma rodhaini]|uniref:SCP domain-containing protein n=1 Tax=Schistosoma rodhaini TaxID=6188 RepID=A0AA85GHB6_9TREM|nr:unnamed protein product [Schistosoma rodhaini]
MMIKLSLIFLLNIIIINADKSSTKDLIFNFHNKIREDVLKGVLHGQPKAKKMSKLKWNKLLAKLAKDHVEKCILDSGDLGKLYVGKFDSVGQTVAEHTSIQNILDTWLEEKNDYDLDKNTCENECGNYKQLVWANTTDIGCASNKCDNRYMVVCNYAPGANDERPYEKD